MGERSPVPAPDVYEDFRAFLCAARRDAAAAVQSRGWLSITSEHDWLADESGQRRSDDLVGLDDLHDETPACDVSFLSDAARETDARTEPRDAGQGAVAIETDHR